MPAPDQSVLARRDEIAAALRAIVPGEGVITAEHELRPYESDGLTAYRQPPMLVVLPETTAQVSRVLAWCQANGVKVVPRGSGTSLSGGALPLADGVLLGMSKFNRILDIDYENRCVTVEPGVTNLGITRPSRTEAFTMRPTRRPRLPARSAAMSRKIPAAFTASNTGLPPTICSASRSP